MLEVIQSGLKATVLEVPDLQSDERLTSRFRGHQSSPITAQIRRFASHQLIDWLFFGGIALGIFSKLHWRRATAGAFGELAVHALPVAGQLSHESGPEGIQFHPHVGRVVQHRPHRQIPGSLVWNVDGRAHLLSVLGSNQPEHHLKLHRTELERAIPPADEIKRRGFRRGRSGGEYQGPGQQRHQQAQRDKRFQIHEKAGRGQGMFGMKA